MTEPKTLNDFKDMVAIMAYGMTAAQAHREGICISCREPVNVESLPRLIDQDEYRISGLCPKCFKAIADEEEARLEEMEDYGDKFKEGDEDEENS